MVDSQEPGEARRTCSTEEGGHLGCSLEYTSPNLSWKGLRTCKLANTPEAPIPHGRRREVCPRTAFQGWDVEVKATDGTAALLSQRTRKPAACRGLKNYQNHGLIPHTAVVSYTVPQRRLFKSYLELYVILFVNI